MGDGINQRYRGDKDNDMNDNDDNDMEVRDMSEDIDNGDVDLRAALGDLPSYDEVVRMMEEDGAGPDEAREKAEINEIMLKLGDINAYVQESEYLPSDVRIAVLTGTLELMLRVALPILAEDDDELTGLLNSIDWTEG